MQVVKSVGARMTAEQYYTLHPTNPSQPTTTTIIVTIGFINYSVLARWRRPQDPRHVPLPNPKFDLKT